MKKCKNCNELTKNKVYCSLKCRDEKRKGSRIANYVKINCKTCVKEFEITQKQFENGKKYCSVNCQHEGSRGVIKSVYIKVNCLYCKKEFERTENQINVEDKGKYCSRICKDEHQKEIYKKEGNPAYGKEHTDNWKKQQSIIAIKMWKNDKYRKKAKDGQEKFAKENGYWCGTDEKSKNKRKKTFIKKYGVDHNWKVKEIRDKCEKTTIERHGKPSFELMTDKLKKTGITSIEKIINKILKNNNIKFERSFYVYDKNKKYKIYDFYLSKYNLLIEADGIYWHAHPDFFKSLNEMQKKNVKNDKFKNNLAKEKGYNLIRFWENKIKEDNFEIKLLKEIKKYEKKD